MTKKIRRTTIDLYRKYEGKLQRLDEPVSYSGLAEAWGLYNSTISNWYNGIRSIPEYRHVWAFRRYKSLGLTGNELMEHLLNDLSVKYTHERLG